METNMEYGSDHRYIPMTSIGSGEGVEALPDLYCYTVQIVNIGLLGDPGSKEYVLIDAGMPGSAQRIIEVTEERYGTDSRPKAIILTHGHFDHVGAVVDLVQHWGIPVYAHESELPFLTGQRSYPEPDPTVEGGWVAKMSPLFPIEPTQLGERVQALPADGSVPYAADFRWVHTPGHSPGHVSLFRDTDRALIAGDAFVTVRQDSLYKVITQEVELNGPPRYLTTDWQAAWDSVKQLAALHPSVAVCGHGMPMSGDELSVNLDKLANEFDRIAIPDYGKYVNTLS